MADLQGLEGAGGAGLQPPSVVNSANHNAPDEGCEQDVPQKLHNPTDLDEEDEARQADASPAAPATSTCEASSSSSTTPVPPRRRDPACPPDGRPGKVPRTDPGAPDWLRRAREALHSTSINRPDAPAPSATPLGMRECYGEPRSIATAIEHVRTVFGPNWQSAIDPTHRPSLAGPYVYCRCCGHYTEGHRLNRALAAPCAGDPDQGLTTAQRRNNLAAGLHPKTRARVAEAVWPLPLGTRRRHA